MSLYEGARTRVRMDCELSEEFEVNVEMHHGSVSSRFVFAVVLDFVTVLARGCVLCELLYDDDLVLMSDTHEGLRKIFRKWKEVLRAKVRKLTLQKPW